jgi:Flp pilus assembly protein TadG
MNRRDRGAAAVEMALVLPILLLLVFGIIDFGRMLHTQIQLSEAAREGARAATIQNTSAAATARVAAVLGTTPVTVTVDGAPTPCRNAAPGSDARVKVDHTFTFVTPFAVLAGVFGGSGSSTVSMTATGVMPCHA